MTEKIAVVKLGASSVAHAKCRACYANDVISVARVSVWVGTDALLCAGCLAELERKIREIL